ncbi:MAG: beta subunit of hydroxylase component of benzoate 1,2-dioxygenase [Solirubrobacterales bacterium]|nr:beta subunit of hydroxylase component of benzoate 1,2-dioxygenase [Solirubrobacterales bacterium]
MVTAHTTTAIPLEEVERFLYKEARFADTHSYDDWEALWADDAVYWVPAQADDIDPTMQMSIIFDNRARIGTRVRQFHTGKRHAQTPPSRLCRSVTNIELLEQDGDEVLVASNVLIVESRERGTQLWAARCEHRLRREGDDLRLVTKKVMLVDIDRAVYTLAFIV